METERDDIRQIQSSLERIDRKVQRIVDSIPLLAHAVGEAEIRREMRKKQAKLKEAAERLIGGTGSGRRSL